MAEYLSKHYTVEQIDQRLLQGWYDDVKAAGYAGTKQQFDQMVKTVLADFNNKVSKVEGKGLSTNDFTNELKKKLDSLSNYDDTEIKKSLKEVLDSFSAIEKDLETVLGSQDYIEAAIFDASTTNPDAIQEFGDSRIADMHHHRVVVVNKETGAVTVLGTLMDNNHFRYKDGSFAPTVIISDSDYDASAVALYSDALGHNQVYAAGAFDAVDCYERFGLNPDMYNSEGEKVYIRAPWESKDIGQDIVYAPDKEYYCIDGVVSGDKMIQAAFEKESTLFGVTAKKVEKTGYNSYLPTLKNNVLRSVYFKTSTGVNCGANGQSNLTNLFNRTDRAYPKTNVSQINTMTYARAKNKETTSPLPCAEGMMFHKMAIVNLLNIKHKTYNLHAVNKFGGGISSNYAVNASSWGNVTGVRYKVDGAADWTYATMGATPSFRYNASNGSTNFNIWLNQEYSKERTGESQMALSFVAESLRTDSNVGSAIQPETDFQFDGETYYYKLVPDTEGLSNGKMNARLYKKLSDTFSAWTSAGVACSVEMEVILEIGVIEGLVLWGDVFDYCGGGFEAIITRVSATEGNNGNPKRFYLCTEQSKLVYENVAKKNAGESFLCETAPGYEDMGEGVIDGEAYRTRRIPYSIAGTTKGGSLNTGLCQYGSNYDFSSGASINGKARQGFRGRGLAYWTAGSARAWHGNYACSRASRTYAAAFQIALP